ncbi:type VI secretion system Vgr family protein [Methylocaldum szegediense]|uniref:type VI secretion system Vgr family protein n=1 Tax=Methylocaldum szegediense TaxID=73780 RepID=UPI0003F8205D|nr:type VI secretion system tip protein VgrG [Methylocaldum szegediense]
MVTVTQEFRPIEVVSPFGKDVLLFHRMAGQERLSGLFEYELDLLSTNPALAPDRILSQSLTVKLRLPDGSHRYFNGFVSRFGHYGSLGEYAYYRASVRPWLWFLTRTTNCRIFQEKTVPEIIKQVFRDKGFWDFEERLSDAYPTREYCVQYRESDFNFVSRLMEEEGIYYFFEHQEGKHTLVLGDSVTAHKATRGYEEIPFIEPGNIERRKRDHIYEWSFAQEVQPVNYVLTDFDFENPNADLKVKAAVARNHAHAEYECYDYPGKYKEAGRGENYVRRRIEELQAQFEQVEGKANARGLTTGALFTLIEHPRRDQEREYLVTSASYQLQSDDYFTVAGGSTGDIYRCTFTAIASEHPYRSPRVTPKPIVQGPQTAIVTGKAGEEIWTDEHGRVKVQFHWDREGKRDENSSCWVRVSHPWAGKGWGAVSIPRIGQEVIVDFLEGDPDRPIITGRVYNGEAMPPYPLPGAAVISGIKSNTHKGQGYNEISMDDTAGKEQVTIHAQYDMNTTVEHDQITAVKNNRTTTVTVDDTLTVDANRTMHIKGQLSETVDAGHLLTVKGGLTEDITDGRTITVTGPIDQSSTSTTDLHAVGAGTYTSDTSLRFAVAGSMIEITPQAITISMGASTIKIDPTGVSITAPKISLNG